MSENTSVGCSGPSLFGLWLLAFLVVKAGGTALAAWSWWWVLLPIVPMLVLICTKLGWMGA